MLTGTVKGKLAAFVVLAVLTTVFLSVRYVGLDRYVGGYEVTVVMPEAGGLFTNSEVTYRGVPVGHVESLEPTESGVTVVVRIDPDAPDMPAELEARVVDRSAIGEQYLDLRGGSLEGELLADGDDLVVTASGLPPRIDGLLRSSRDFVESVPSDALTTVIDEAYALSRGNGPHLARLVETSADFGATANRNFLVTASLIENSGTVLATQEASADSFQSFSRDLSLLADALSEQDASWRQLFKQTPEAALQFDRLFATVGQPLGQLMSNLISTAQVFGTNAAGVRETLIKLPEGISITYAIMTSKGMRMGVTPTFFNPEPCTNGYEDTPMRPGLETSEGAPFNLEAGCRGSDGNVRGPQAARVTVTGSLDDLMGGTP
jgi:phospholipid/cholesterol/gamma-HCH transport system substrate-binding protein